MPTILCAADDRHFCKIVEKSLVAEGYRVITAHDGERALADLAECEPQLVILDILLSRLDGFEVLKRIRSSESEMASVPVVLMSSFRLTSQYEERARELRAQALLVKPVPLKRLLSLTTKYVKEPPPRVTETPRRRFPLMGSFAEIAFPHLLHQLHGLRASGVLQLTSGKKRKLVELRDGYPVALKSNLVNECLGNGLVRRGLITRDVFEESVQRMKRGDGLQGQILVAMSVLEEDALGDALRQQALDKLFEVFSWKNGRFRFQKDARLQRANTLSVEQSPANLVIEGVRRSFPIEQIDAFFARYASCYIHPGASDFYRLQEISLLPGEEELISGLDGSHRLGDYAAVEERCRRTLYGLLITEFLELRGPSAKQPVKVSTGSEPAQGGNGKAAKAKRVPANGRRAQSNKDQLMRAELTKLASQLRGQNYFDMLAVPEDAESHAIRSAFEKAARRVHPDRYSAAGTAVRELAQEAYDLLSQAHETLADPRSRTAYVLECKKGARLAAAEAATRRALEAELEFQKGEALLRTRSYEKALGCFGKALEANSEEGEYHAHYGWCLYLCHSTNTDMIQESVEHVRRGIQLSPDRATPYLYLGRLHKAVGRSAAAEKMFTRALQILPECVEAVRELRLINLRREKKGLIGRLLRR